MVTPRAKNGTVSKISNQIVFPVMRRRFLRFVLDVVLRPSSRRKEHEWRASQILRCLSGLVRTGGSHDGTDVDRILLIAALATGDELEPSQPHLTCLTHVHWGVVSILRVHDCGLRKSRTYKDRSLPTTA